MGPVRVITAERSSQKFTDFKSVLCYTVYLNDLDFHEIQTQDVCYTCKFVAVQLDTEQKEKFFFVFFIVHPSENSYE
jgi:hypothetical protein